ncbi:MAG: MafI family immunity protein [Actinomycetota bacterium]|nr:MafI family immunity protein [Actinomycetota bacterium]
MSRFDAAYYEDLRGRVRGVLIAVAGFFPAQEVGIVDELIDANESGVALEMLSEMLVEAKARIEPQVVEQILRLVRDMGLLPDLAERVRRLEAT